MAAAAEEEEERIDDVAGVDLISARFLQWNRFAVDIPRQELWRWVRQFGRPEINMGSLHQLDSVAPSVKSFVKKLLSEVESDHGEVLDELYQSYTEYVTTIKEEDSAKGNSWALKHISFLFPDTSRRWVVPLQCSRNMLEGDTGCSIWTSSLYLSELILSHPELFSGKSCFEVILTDGDLSSLANLEINLKLNNITPHNLELDSAESALVKV